MRNLDEEKDEAKVAAIGHGLRFAGGGQGAIFMALGLLFQATGAKAVVGNTVDVEDEVDDAGSSWWPLKVILMVFLLLRKLLGIRVPFLSSPHEHLPQDPCRSALTRGSFVIS